MWTPDFAKAPGLLIMEGIILEADELTLLE